MALFELKPDRIEPLRAVKFAGQGIRERQDLQRLLLEHLHVVVPDTMVLAEEFGDWEESRRRIDILGIDKDANIVVVELKRTERGGHMDLQAVRYAAMVSTMTFAQAAAAHQKWLDSTGSEQYAEQAILDHLGWEEPSEEDFGTDVKIVLVSADFSREVTTSALWLSQHDIDISCVRLIPYELEGRLILDVQRIIPVPEAGEYLERVRDKARAERQSRRGRRDLTKYDISIEGKWSRRLPKNRSAFLVIRQLCRKGVHPSEISDIVAWKRNLWYEVDGEVDAPKFAELAAAREASGGPVYRPRRWYHQDDELIRADGKTYAVTTQWARRTGEAIELLLTHWPDHGVACVTSEEE